MLYPSRKATEKLGVCANTLRVWANEGKIRYVKTAAGQRLYDVASFLAGGIPRKRYIYCRVSSRNQREDLARQVGSLRERYPNHEVIEDIGSGLSFKRKGFRALLDGILSGAVEEVVVAHKDRLCRFGFELLELIGSKNNCKIVVLDDAKLSPQGELVADLVSILHVFSCRLYGLRKYGRALKKDPHLSEVRKHDEVKTIPGPVEVLVQPNSQLPETAGNKSELG